MRTTAFSLELQRAKRILTKVNALAPTMRAMSDQKLKAQTPRMQKMLKDGKSLNSLLPMAFATAREAARRVLGMYPYDVQVIGAIVLHHGWIAEMKTGEGKTLTAALPLYLNGLTGKGAILVTPSRYLAQRDQEELSVLYKWLGLTCSLGFDPNDETGNQATVADKRKWYQADVLYTTGSTLAFDYLFNNLASRPEDQYLRPYNYAIIDEVDAVFLDGANSPMVVASKPELQSNLYQLTDEFVRSLRPETDYRRSKNHKSAWLTHTGVLRAQKWFRINDLFDNQHRELYRHISLALQAHFVQQKGHDYMVDDGEVVLLNEANGRLMRGMKVNTGIQQAVEQKEGVKISENRQAVASITYQGLFTLFNNVAGMTGTAKIAESEFINVYKMKVVQIPRHRKNIRKDHQPRVYLTTSEKLIEAIKLAEKLHHQGRPILLIAGSVENSEIVSEILLNRGIPHNVLNARNEANEAAIIKNAGQRNAVTVSTNIAGRGTDIKLGRGVAKLGGLAVIGTEMLDPRVAEQLQGRAGRQGDPGDSWFFISLEDNFISQNSSPVIRRYYRRHIKHFNHKAKSHRLYNPRILISLLLLRDKVMVSQRQTRARMYSYENSMRLERMVFYELRDAIMNAKDYRMTALNWMSHGFDVILKQRSNWDYGHFKAAVNHWVTYDDAQIPTDLNYQDKNALKDFLMHRTSQILDQIESSITDPKQIDQFYRSGLLKAMDDAWVDQVAYLGYLKTLVQPWTLLQRNPMAVYHDKAYDRFKQMINDITKETIRNLLLSTIDLNEDGEVVVYFV